MEVFRVGNRAGVELFRLVASAIGGVGWLFGPIGGATGGPNGGALAVGATEWLTEQVANNLEVYIAENADQWGRAPGVAAAGTGGGGTAAAVILYPGPVNGTLLASTVGGIGVVPVWIGAAGAILGGVACAGARVAYIQAGDAARQPGVRVLSRISVGIDVTHVHQLGRVLVDDARWDQELATLGLQSLVIRKLHGSWYDFQIRFIVLDGWKGTWAFTDGTGSTYKLTAFMSKNRSPWSTEGERTISYNDHDSADPTIREILWYP